MALLIQKLLGNKITVSLLNLIARVSLGQGMANVLSVAHMITKAVEKDDVQDISTCVFAQLPAVWKAPEGAATEREFVDTIRAGEAFIKRVLALTVK